MALFDDAARFDSYIVVGDTVVHGQRSTKGNIGPGTYRLDAHSSLTIISKGQNRRCLSEFERGALLTGN